MEYEDKIKELESELEKTRKELNDTKEHLKKYTAPISRRIYYEKNKEKEKQRQKHNQRGVIYLKKFGTLSLNSDFIPAYQMICTTITKEILHLRTLKTPIFYKLIFVKNI